MGSSLVCTKATAGLIALSAVLVIVIVGLIAGFVKLEEREESIAMSVARDEGWKTNYRIPEDTLPLHYELYLNPRLESGLFEGKVFIHVNVTKPRNYLVTHIKNLIIGKSELHSGLLMMDDPTVDPKQIPLANTQSFGHPENEFLVMTKDGEFAPGMYTWYIKFSGSLTDGIVGFYRSVYKTSKGEERFMATSKFQPTYARRAFPCFDEPSFKSKFRVMLVRPTDGGYIALSNMPVEKEVAGKPDAKSTIVHFKESVNMVTYLACFIVCDFEYSETITNNRYPFRVYARPEQKFATDYSLQLGTNISDSFVDYFGVPYPLPKQDMIAIPDFVSGAMEHWGLITYREVNLLYNEATSSAANKQRVATVVSHELAHMWFGNLVTLKWWDDLWLNEGFASYVEYKGVDPFEPHWEMTTQFISMDLVPVMDLDAQLSSHPIVQAVHHPDEITQLFDTISYNKGASVLRMLEDFLSENIFRAGVSAFLKKFAYANAVTQDLWDSLQQVWTSNNALNVGEIMDTWTKQMGYPMISVKQTDSGFELTQTRFLADPNATPNDDSPYKYKWDVPISYRYWTGSKWEDGRTWLLRSQEKVVIPKVGSEEWIKINNNFKGYYVVNYETDTWMKFAAQFASAEERKKWTSAADRANLIADAFKLASAGKLSYAIPLELVKSLNLETHAVPFDVAYSGMENVRKLLSSTEVADAFHTFLRDISAPLYDGKYGFKDPGNNDVLGVQLQNRVIHLACTTKYEPCVAEAERQFKEWLDKGGRLSPNLRGLIYKYGMTAPLGTGANWQKMFDRFLSESEPQERVAFLIGLASTPDKEQLSKYIELAKDPKNVRQQDFFTVISYISRNPAGTDLAWDFYRNEWESFLVPTFTLNDRYLGNLVKTLTSSFATEQLKKEMEDFFAKYPDAGAGSRARTDALEAVNNNILWMQRSVGDIKRWLETH